MAKFSCLCLSGLVAFAACHTPPPRPWLRYELDGGTKWSPLGAGKFGGSLHGANFSIDLFNPETRVLVTVENPSGQAIKVELGPEAGASKDAMGEVLLRELDGPVAGGPDMQPYVARQSLTVDSGWRATFYLDRPLGRDVKLGQYFVLGTVCENSSGERVRRLLPLMGKMGGTVPVKPK